MFKIYSCIRCNHRYHNHYRYFKTINNENGNWLLQFDGGSRGLCEPRIAGAGAVLYAIEDDIKRIEKWTGYFFIGNATNNVAEYIALIEGIKQAIHFDIKNITIEGDSQLVISQLNGIYKVKHSNLIPLYKEAKAMMKEFKKCESIYIPRELNRRADELSNIAMDLRTSSSVTNID